jgi:hypothetical protein
MYWLPCSTVMLLYNFSSTRPFFKPIRLCYMQTIVNKHRVTLSTFLNLYTCQIRNLKMKQMWAAHHLRKAQFKNVFRNYTHHQEYYILLITKMKCFLAYNFRVLNFTSLFCFFFLSSLNVSVPKQQTFFILSPSFHEK